MPKYLDLEAHFETDMSVLFGMKKPEHAEETVEEETATEIESED